MDIMCLCWGSGSLVGCCLASQVSNRNRVRTSISVIRNIGVFIVQNKFQASVHVAIKE